MCEQTGLFAHMSENAWSYGRNFRNLVRDLLLRFLVSESQKIVHGPTRSRTGTCALSRAHRKIFVFLYKAKCASFFFALSSKLVYIYLKTFVSSAAGCNRDGFVLPLQIWAPSLRAHPQSGSRAHLSSRCSLKTAT